MENCTINDTTGHYYKALGQHMWRCRKLRGFTRDELANIIGATRQHIEDIETGCCRVSVIELWHLCIVFQIKIEDVLIKIDDAINSAEDI